MIRVQNSTVLKKWMSGHETSGPGGRPAADVDKGKALEKETIVELLVGS